MRLLNWKWSLPHTPYDYSLDTWTVANDLLEHRKQVLLTDGSVRKVRIEYEMIYRCCYAPLTLN